MAFYRKPIYSIFIAIILLASCTVIKNYPKNQPFVAENKIQITTTTLKKEEKKKLLSDLGNYWDDSLKVRSSKQFGITDIIKNPPVFDSTNIERTKNNMKAYLASYGYYNAQFKDSTYFIKPNQFKKKAIGGSLADSLLIVGISISIDVGKNLTIDSISYVLVDTNHNSINDSTLQKLTLANLKSSLLKKNAPYSKQVIAAELDRLVNLFHNNGFYKISRENIIAEIDTTDTRLLELTLDPFEQATKIAEAAKRRLENPTAVITIMQKPVKDSSKIWQYHVGNLFFYPETKIYEDTDSLLNDPTLRSTDTSNAGYVFKDRLGKFKPRPLRLHTYMRKGNLYNEADYLKTINALNQLGAWQQVDVKTKQWKTDSLNYIDFHIFLNPAPRRSILVDFQTSRNTGDIGVGSLFGIANVITLTHRNVWKEAIQSSTTLRNGIELSFADGQKLLQTFQSNLSHNYTFPRFITPFFEVKRQKRMDNPLTIFDLNASYTDRNQFFRLKSFTTSWGYSWSTKKKNERRNNWLYRPIDIGLYALDTLPLLDTAFKYNPFLRNAFNTGYVISQSITFSTQFTDRKNPQLSHNFKASIEEAGSILGFFSGLRDKIYRYIKFTAEYKGLIQKKKTAIAFRLFGGAGFNYSDDPFIGNTLPFFKQFSAGGSNSMRAWQPRQLGLGSSIASDTLSINQFRDRFGDMQLEANFEYRFIMGEIGGIKLGGALFTDIGNIWNVKQFNLTGSEFQLSRLWKDIAIASGLGLRIDFSNYFLIRLDLGYKIKDPARSTPGGWLQKFQFSDTRANGIEVNNMALQLGIGLPF